MRVPHFPARSSWHRRGAGGIPSDTLYQEARSYAARCVSHKRGDRSLTIGLPASPRLKRKSLKAVLGVAPEVRRGRFASQEGRPAP